MAYPAPPSTAEKIPHYNTESAQSKSHAIYACEMWNRLTFAAPTKAPLPPSQAASLASSDPRPPVLRIVGNDVHLWLNTKGCKSAPESRCKNVMSL